MSKTYDPKNGGKRRDWARSDRMIKAATTRDIIGRDPANDIVASMRGFVRINPQNISPK
jgi:hypothetical protein